ncbi:MAG TPA: protein kinase [Candidatus Eisenbacteria bacterium]|nr:protein kinase [Candidatus Eisenbacteria bacterium]
MALAPGLTLGQHRIAGLIGAGGMGEVYRARDVRLGRDVALKVLPEATARDARLLARFTHEAKTLAALNHPNIVTIYSIEEAEGIRYLTMELVEGTSLDRLIESGGLPPSRVLDLAIPLTDALAAAHAKGIVHRDLKPGNVMVSREGWVKVLDFGLATVVGGGDAPAPMMLTASEPSSGVAEASGTAPYMSPEQIRGEAVDHRTDIFALGVVLFELATGRRPFGGGTRADVAAAILRDEPPPFASLRDGIPHGLGRIVARCLAKAPEARYQAVREVRRELDDLRRDLVLGSAASRWAPPPAEGTRAVASIAVLPFANVSGDVENEYFSDGLAEELLNVLVKIRGLRVAARTSSFQFRATRDDPATIARALRVETLLEGSVRKSGNRVRIAVQLVRASEGFQIWSGTYDRTLDDIFAVQDEIARSVVTELRATLLGDAEEAKSSGAIRAEVAAAAKGRGEGGESHRHFLQGRYLVGRFTREESEKGLHHLREAVRLDPGFAQAWVELARAHMFEAAYGWASVDEGFGKAREAVDRALSLEANLAEAHAARARILFTYDWDFEGAERSYRRALELEPANADVLRSMGTVAHRRGRIEEALDLFRRSLALDPLSIQCYANLGFVYHDLGDLPLAESAFRSGLELSPHRIAARSFLGVVLAEQGREEEALAEAGREPEEAYRLRALAIIHHARGRTAEADRALEELIGKYAGDSAYQIAEVCAARGEADRAFEWLERAYAQRDGGVTELKPNRLFQALHRDPRWAALLDQMGLGD